MITICEEILLLVLDYDTGRVNTALPGRCVGAALGGAVLMDLALMNRIDTDLQELFVVDSRPPGEPLLDRALARIVGETGRHAADHWVGVFAADQASLREQLTDRLVERGIVARDRYGRLLVMGVHGGVRDVRRRIAGELMSDDIPDPRDIMIISLADTCSLWQGLIEAASLARLQPKIRQIARLDLIGQAVARVLDERQG